MNDVLLMVTIIGVAYFAFLACLAFAMAWADRKECQEED